MVEWFDAYMDGIEDGEEDRIISEHYGPYGAECINTGQFYAGECWKCKIRRLEKEVEKLKITILDVAAMPVEFEGDKNG